MARYYGWLLVFFVACAAPAYGQEYFNERYPNGGLFSGATTLAPADSGGFLLAGQADYPASSGFYGLLLRRLGADGQSRWARIYTEANQTLYPGSPHSLIRTRDGGYVLPVVRASSAATNSGMLWRFNTQGDTIWVRRYIRRNETALYTCRQAIDGGFIVAGNELVAATGVIQLLLLRTDSLGQVVWERTYPMGAYDTPFNLELTADGGYVLSGYTFDDQQITNSDGFVLKVDSSGTEQWRRILGTAFNLEAACATPTRDGGYIVAGNRGTLVIGSAVQSRPTFYKLDAQGQVIWQRIYGESRSLTAFTSVHELADGSFVAAGQHARLPVAGQVLGSGYTEGLIVKVCADGDSLWYRTYQKLTGGTSSNYLRDLQPQPDGSFVGAGFVFARAPDTGTQDVWAFRIDSAGYLQAGGAPVTGQCRPLGTGLTAPAPEVGVEVWPNPSPDGRYALRLARAGRVEVVDGLGRVVWRGELGAGVSEVDLRGLPAGVYGLRVGGLRPQLIIKNE